MSFIHRGFFCLAAVTIAAAGCTSFGTDEGPKSDAAVPDPTPAEASVDLPDATVDAVSPPVEAGACARAKAGTSSPCVGCVSTPFYMLPPRPDVGVVGPHIFGIVADETHVFWLEQIGGVSYDGAGDVTLVKRKRRTGDDPAETLTTFNGPFTRLVVDGAKLWIASGTRTAPVRTIDKSCVVGGCTAKEYAQVQKVDAMFPYAGGIAIASGGSVLTYPANGGAPATSSPPRGVRGMAEWQSKLAIVAENAESASTIGFSSGTASLPLLSEDPGRPMFPSVGANMLASTCDDLWAYQIFKADGGGEHTAIVLANAPGGPRGTVVNELTFAIGADTTHAYLGLPNRKGLRRVSKATTTLEVVANDVSPFSLAIMDDVVYFDDHGTSGSLQSNGIYALKKSE